MDTRVTPKDTVYGLHNGRVFMDSVNHFHILEVFHNAFYRMADVFQGLSQIFPTVGSHGNDTFALEVDGIQFFFMEGIIFFDGMCQSVDNCIAGDENAVSVDVFFQQMFLCQFGRRKVQVCEGPCQAAVHFFGERLILIIGTQTSFHMTHFHLIIICSQCTCECGGCVPMDQYDVGFFLRHNFFQPCEGTGGDACQCLAALHDIQIVFGMQIENLQNLIQHFSMLGGDADDAFDAFRLFQHFHQRCHFDGFGTGAEYTHYLNHIFLHNILLLCYQCYPTKQTEEHRQKCQKGLPYFTSLVSLPMPSISQVTTSPAFRNLGGSKPIPTPAGVPMAMMVPACKVMP